MFVASRFLWTKSIALPAIRQAVRLLTRSDLVNLATKWLTECPCRIHPAALRMRILFSVWVVMATKGVEDDRCWRQLQCSCLSRV